MASSVLRTNHLTKDFFGGFWGAKVHRALDDVSLDVPAGAVFGLLGPNGAGKSTTLNLLLNLLRPTSGTIAILGRPADDVSLKHRIGFLPEHPLFYDHLTPEGLLNYFAGLFGRPSPGAFERDVAAGWHRAGAPERSRARHPR
jgi:ABC-2 type transport system ATP-binding protein